MSRQHLIISVVVAIVVIVFVAIIFTRNNVGPEVDGSTTADTYTEQVTLPAGPASEPAQTTTAN